MAKMQAQMEELLAEVQATCGHSQRLHLLPFRRLHLLDQFCYSWTPSCQATRLTLGACSTWSGAHCNVAEAVVATRDAETKAKAEAFVEEVKHTAEAHVTGEARKERDHVVHEATEALNAHKLGAP